MDIDKDKRLAKEQDEGEGDTPLSATEFEDIIVEYNRTKPVVLDEEEFRQHLRETAICRSNRAEQMLEDVVDLLQKLAAKMPDSGEDIDFGIETIHKANNVMKWGWAGYNRGAQKTRAVLWYPPAQEDAKSSEDG